MARDGAAREVAPGRLARFEDDDEDLVKDDRPRLPPRGRRGTGTGGAPGPVAAEPAPAPTMEQPPSPTQTAPTTPQPPAEATPTPAPVDAPVDAPARPVEAQNRMRPSNVHVPVTLLEPIDEACRSRGMSHGELIIAAIEATYAELPGLIRPSTTTGGSLFATRRSRAVRSKDGPLSPLNYRLRGADFAVIDQLVDELGASSRGDLITTALTAYLSPTGH